MENQQTHFKSEKKLCVNIMDNNQNFIFPKNETKKKEYLKNYRSEKIKCEKCLKLFDKSNISRHKKKCKPISDEPKKNCKFRNHIQDCDECLNIIEKIIDVKTSILYNQPNNYKYLRLRQLLKELVNEDEELIYFRNWKHYINKVHAELIN